MKLIPAFIDDFLLWRRERMDKALIKTLEDIAENKHRDCYGVADTGRVSYQPYLSGLYDGYTKRKIIKAGTRSRMKHIR